MEERNDNTIYSAIHWACYNLNLDKIKDLLKNGHHWFAINIDIVMCQFEQHPEEVILIVKFLTKENADKQGDRFITQDEIKYGYGDNYYDYPQFQPCLRGSLELVRHFEELGYPVNSDSFHQALYWGRIEIVRYLIETEKFSISDINIEMVRKNNRVELLEYLESL